MKMLPQSQTVVVVGLSGSGRTTALNAFEDFGFERIDNLPLSLFDEFMKTRRANSNTAFAVGIAPHSPRDIEKYAHQIETAREQFSNVGLLYLSATDDILTRRYSESRRPHPFVENVNLQQSITEERRLLECFATIADSVIDTSALSPHELKSLIGRHFEIDHNQSLTISIQSFSYKHGVPANADLVFDCRFLRNPHWDLELRSRNGLDANVQTYIQDDPNHDQFRDDIERMLAYILPAVRKERRSYFSIAFGCSGGRHRSVHFAELINSRLDSAEWFSQTSHRELERLGELKDVTHGQA